VDTRTAPCAGGNGGSGIVIVRYAAPPQVSNVGSQNRSNISADVVGALTTNGGPADAVYLYWSTTDGTNNASAWTTGGGNVSNLGARRPGRPSPTR